MVVAAAVTGPGMVFGLQTSLLFSQLARAAIPSCGPAMFATVYADGAR
jgi:hypothetical protein